MITQNQTKTTPKQLRNGVETIPNAHSRPSPRGQKLRQICGPDAHQTPNAAGWQRATFNQTADSFGADRQLLGRGFDRQKRGKGRHVGCGCKGIRLSLRHGQALPPLIAQQPSAALPIAPRPAPVPPKQHAPHPPRRPKLRVEVGPVQQRGARVGSCESRYVTPKNHAGENPVTGSERVIKFNW
jgi:hypothetical protein